MQSILFIGADFEQYLRLKAILNKLTCVYSVSLPDGIRQFNQQQFCLLILDLSLITSDVGQEELLRFFRRAHPVPIIALCGNTEDSNIVRLLGAGADQTLATQTPDELLAAYTHTLVNRYALLNNLCSIVKWPPSGARSTTIKELCYLFILFKQVFPNLSLIQMV